MDSYDQATTALQAQQKDMLAAMAQAGTAGQQAYTNAQQQIASQQQNAVQQALAQAARSGAPQGMQDSIAYQIGAPDQAAITDMTQANQSRQQSLNATQAAGQNVIQEALANIPALRAMSERQARAELFKAQQQAQADQLSMDLKNADMQIKNAELQKAMRGGSDNPLVDMERQLHIQQMQQSLDKGGMSDQQQGVLQNAQQHLGGSSSNGYRVLQTVLSKAKNYNDAMGGLDYAYSNGLANTPGGRPLDRGALESFINQYYA